MARFHFHVMASVIAIAQEKQVQANKERLNQFALPVRQRAICWPLLTVIVTQECRPLRQLPKEFRVQASAHIDASLQSTVTTKNTVSLYRYAPHNDVSVNDGPHTYTMLCYVTLHYIILYYIILYYIILYISYLFTYSMEQSPSWEANWFAASQEIPCILRNPKVHYRHLSLSWASSIHSIPPHPTAWRSIYYNII